MVVEKQKRRRGKKNSDGHTGNTHVKDDTSASGYKPHNSFLINISEEEAPMWYECAKSIPGRDDSIFDVETPSTNTQNTSLARKYRSLADEIYRAELSLTGATSSGGKAASDERWVENTMKRGTLKDRIAATSVLVSTDPVHKLSSLDNLLSMAGCTDAGQSNSRVAQMAAEALEDLFLNTLFPPGRKLLSLEQRPLSTYEASSNMTLSPRVLLLWRFEEMLKERFQSFLNGYLVATLRDGMDLNKTFALRTAGTMLRSTPEGEAQLLSMMVNKLGDPGKKIAASAGHELRRVLEEHDNMQEIAAREVQQLAHRPQLSPRALYNCIVFLNQLKLRKETQDKEKEHEALPLAVSLVNTYFRMFDVAVKKQSDEKSGSGMKSRLLSALLTGINRAHPFLPDKDQGLEEHMDSLYNVSHTAAPAASTQALMLLFHVAVGPPGENKQNEAKQKKQDRFYRAVYAKLSMPSFLGSGKHLTMFFNLLYKTMKHDTDAGRVLAFAKRLMCTVVHANASVAAASLFLLNEIMKTHHRIAGCLNDIPEGDSAQLGLDPSKREPRAAIVHYGDKQVDSSDLVPPLWEICLVSNHFHPSVGKFAASLGAIDYSGDPLRDFALAPFLDKFSYKNPKAHKKGKLSIAQRRIETQVNQPVNDPAFLRQHHVDDADKFFHKFFLERARRDDINGVSQENDDEDDLDAEDEEFDMLEEHQIDHVFKDDASTDVEEEEFVHKLAESLMDEAPDHGQVDFDDEDPDMDDWDDIKEDDNNLVSRDSDDQDSNEDSDNANGNSDGGDVDEEEDSSDDEHQGLVDQAGHADEDDFMDASDSGDDSESALFLAANDDSDDEDEQSRGGGTTKSKKETKRKADLDVFADADKYEERVSRSHLDREKKGLSEIMTSATVRPSKKKRKGKN